MKQVILVKKEYKRIDGYRELKEGKYYKQIKVFGDWKNNEDIMIFQYKNGKRHYSDGDILEGSIYHVSQCKELKRCL